MGIIIHSYDLIICFGISIRIYDQGSIQDRRQLCSYCSMQEERFLDTAFSPLMRCVGLGLYDEVLAKKRGIGGKDEH